MFDYDVLIENAVIVSPEKVFLGHVGIKHGKIVSVQQGYPKKGIAATCLDAREKYLLPGMIDPHVHIRGTPYEYREDYTSASQAAVSGGITCLLEMPVSFPPTTSCSLLVKRMKEAEQGFVDVGFLGGIGETTLNEAEKMKEAGVLGFKTFLHPIPEGREREFTGICCPDNRTTLEVFEAVARTGLPLAVHAQDTEMIEYFTDRVGRNSAAGIREYEAASGVVTETLAVSKALCIAEHVGNHVHICHLSTWQATQMTLEAKNRGVRVTTETCPHYFLASLDDLNDAETKYMKVKPPIRNELQRKRILEFVKRGDIDVLGSDHAPFTLEEKGVTDIWKVPSGLPFLELSLPLMLDQVAKGVLTINTMAKITSEGPARIFGLWPKKGAIAEGFDADLVLVDLHESKTVDKKLFYTKARDSGFLYNGRMLIGRILFTMRRGEMVFENDKVKGKPGTAEIQRRVL